VARRRKLRHECRLRRSSNGPPQRLRPVRQHLGRERGGRAAAGHWTATTAGEGDGQPLDDAEMVERLIVHLARRQLGVSDREARLRAIVLGLRAKAPPAQHDIINQAAEHVRYALNRSMSP
jgi:hypothetical protein